MIFLYLAFLYYPAGFLILGMVVAQYRNDEEVKMLHEKRLIRHRLSLGQVVHAEFVRQTLAAVK